MDICRVRWWHVNDTQLCVKLTHLVKASTGISGLTVLANRFKLKEKPPDE